MAATEPRHFPAAGLPEIAFLGRSNVGKSSVINALVNKKLARTSSVPGRTRSINFFEIRWPGNPRPAMIFTDLPGYGYARVSREVSQTWPDFIQPYLTRRPCLALCLALIDVNVPPQESDRQLRDFLRSVDRPFLLIATKSDRLSNNQLKNAVESLMVEHAGLRVVPFSAKTGEGRDELWRHIRSAAEEYQTASGIPAQAG
jgi:GTP-binding protein